MASSVNSSEGPPAQPYMRVTKYENTSAFLIATAGILFGTLAILVIIWISNLRFKVTDDLVPIELVGGGYEDGAPDETLNIESPEDVTDDPSVADDPSEETELMEMLETVVEMTDNASQMMVTEVQVSGSENKGKPGSAVGTGRRPLGAGGGDGGWPREQRWFVKFAKNDLKKYAAQLDFFGIELGAFFQEKHELVYLKNLSRDVPTQRKINQGKDKRLNMNHAGGDRKKADRALFAKAKVDARGARLMHFYPKATQQMMLRLELAKNGKKSAEIRRTFFVVQKDGNGYKFVVEKQILR